MIGIFEINKASCIVGKCNRKSFKKYGFLLAKSKFINNIPDVTFEDSLLSLEHIKEGCKNIAFAILQNNGKKPLALG